MSNQYAGGLTSEQKLMATFGYVFSPIAPLIYLLVSKSLTNDPYLRLHMVQSLAAWVVVLIISTVTIGCGSILYFIFLYWGYKAWQGENIEIPVITNFVKNQGWA